MTASRTIKLLALVGVVLGYLKARSLVLQRAEVLGQRIGPRWLGMLAWHILNGYSRMVGVRNVSEKSDNPDPLDPKKRYLIVWHPHGFIAWSAMFIASRMAVMGHPHGNEWFAMVAPALFRIPLISELLMLVNGRRVDKTVVDNYLEKGLSIAIQPGGVREQIATDHEQEQAIFPANLGFIRMALKYKMDLLPAYLFNENQMFKRVGGYESITQRVYEKTGFGFPALVGRFGIPMAVNFPTPTDVHVRWGKPIAVHSQVAEPTEQQVEELFGRYINELRRLFDNHAGTCLPPQVAANGLKIIRLDGKPVPAYEPQALPVPPPAVMPSRL